MSNAEEQYQDAGEAGAEGAGTNPDTTQNDYVSRTGQSEIPVQSDDAPVDNPVDGEDADSDAQLQKDDADAIDQGNVIKDRTRGAAPSGGYTEPGDEEGLPTDDGTSSN